MGITLLILCAILPMVVHEAGHYLVALSQGYTLKFYRSGFRYLWKWPDGASSKQIRLICQAGFVAELALMPFMPWSYQVVALIHFITYPWYAGNNSDFEGMI